MKFLNENTFKSYLAKNTNHQYLLVIADDYERKKIIDVILKQSFMQKFSIVKIAQASIAKIMAEMQSFSLFGGDPFIVLQDIKELSKEEASVFFAFLEKNVFFGVIGASSKQDVLKIYSLFEKEKIVFDLNLEKPWEKKSRFSDFIKDQCSFCKMSIDQQAIEALLEKVEDNIALLEQELDKLITYAYEKKQILLEDVINICIGSSKGTIWQIADEIVWQNKDPRAFTIDALFFHGLIAAVRYQLSIACKMSELVESNISSSEFSSYFPKMYPKTVLKKREIAAKHGSLFYKKAICNLFEADLASKNNIDNFALLFDLFKMRSGL